jgi:microcystin-dependent protein
LLYPVGITIEFDGNANAAFPFGTWVEVGSGRVTVGLDTADPDFDTIGKTGGAKAVTLTEAQIPAHSHPVNDPSHSHVEQTNNATTGGLSGWGARDTSTNTASPTSYSTMPATTGITLDSTGGGQAHQNMPPFIVGRKWRRTT